MTNFPIRYGLSWLPRFVFPSTAGDRSGFASRAGVLLPSAKNSVRLVFLGDISAVSGPAVPTVDAPLADMIETADLVVANCESPITGRHLAGWRQRLGMSHAMTRQFFMDLLSAAHIRPEQLVVSVANNHALDLGTEGFDETLGHLDGAGIRTVGARRTSFISSIAVGPLRLGVAAFTQWRNRSQDAFGPNVFVADEIPESSGLDAGDYDLLCAIPHWDWEFSHFPRLETRSLACRLSDAGFGLVAGHHAHVVQPVEMLGETLVAYGLGDFTGTAGSRVRWPLRIGMMLVVDVSVDPGSIGKIARYEAVPIVRERRAQGEHLSLLDGQGEMRPSIKRRVDLVLPPTDPAAA